jgi:hypothetical protein
MLCDKAGKPLPPSECRMLRAWVHTWFVATRQLMLAEPAVRMLPSGVTTAAERKAEVMNRLAEQFVGSTKLCWDVVGEREVVLEGGLQQVGLCTWRYNGGYDSSLCSLLHMQGA